MTQCRDLVEYDGEYADPELIAAELNLVGAESELTKTQETLKALIDEADEITTEFHKDPDVAAIFEEIQRLQRANARALVDLSGLADKIDEENKNERAKYSDEKFTFKRREEEQPKGPRSEKLKRLFKKLAQKCHPDRQKIKEVSDFFPAVLAAYKANDYARLKNLSVLIHAAIKAAKSTRARKEKMNKLLEKLVSMLDMAKQELRDMQSSVTGYIVKFVREGDRDRAKNLYVNALVKTLEEEQRKAPVMDAMSMFAKIFG